MQNQIVTYLKIQNKAHNQLGMKLLRTRVESEKIMLYQISLLAYISTFVHHQTHVNKINRFCVCAYVGLYEYVCVKHFAANISLNYLLRFMLDFN